MTQHARRLSDRGREIFRRWLEDGGSGDPPPGVLDDPEMTVPFLPTVRRPTKLYDSRYDLGTDLVGILNGIDVAQLQTDADLWDWLSLCLIDQICPPDGTGRRRPNQIDRYILQLENHQTRYRHLVRSAWSLVRVHGDEARFMLSGDLHVHGEAAEQLGSRQDLITCKPLIAAIGSLVWDADKATLKRGFRGSGPGSARRVQFVAKQFRLTYDLDSMRPEQILDLLPQEFDRFRGAVPTSKGPRPRLNAERGKGEPRLEAD